VLRRRLLLFGALILVPLAMLLFYGVYRQRQDALDEGRAIVLRTTRAIAERHRAFVTSTTQLLTVLARLPKVREEDWAASTDIFADVVTRFPEYRNLRLEDLEGTIVASVPRSASPTGDRGRDWFEEVVRTSRVAMSGYFIGQTTGAPQVAIATPVLDGRNRLRYVLSVTIDVLRFADVPAADLPDRSIVIVVGRDGIVLARHPDPQNRVGRQLNPRALLDAMQSGPPEGVVESDGLDGTPRLVGYEALPVAPGSPGVYLAIGVPRDRVLAPINRALLVNAGGVALVTALMLAAATIGGRRLVLEPVERELDEAGQRLRIVLDNISDGFFTMDRQWRYTDINPAGARMVGKTPEDLVGRQYLDAFPEAAGTIWERTYRRVMDTQEAATAEEYYEPLDTWFEASVFPFAGGISVFFRDVSVRKRAERAVRESETRLATIVETVPVGLAITRARDGEILFANQRLHAMLSPSRPLVGRLTRDFYVDPPPRERLVSEIVVGGGLRDRLMTYRADTGDRRLLSVSVVSIEQAGEPVLLSALVDVTARELAVEELQHSREALALSQKQLRDVLDSMFVFVGLFSLDGRLLDGNLALLGAAGPAREDVIGQPFADAYWWSFSLDVQLRLRNAMQGAAGGETVRYDTPVRLAGGRLIVMDIAFTPLRGPDGHVAQIVGSGVDITERRRAEDEVTQLNAELEQRVRQRTSELQASNQELESFAYSISHDLRAPLRGIDGFAQALLEEYADRLDDAGRQYLTRVRAAAARMGGLIDELLHLSRLTRGEVRRDVVDLSALVGERAAELAADAGRDATFGIAPGLSVVGDRHLLDAVISNLLDNAWKFTARTPAALIEFGSTLVGDEHAFFVRDNGVGFDMAYADKLFGAFQRLHSVQEFSGSGIGLATVQRIVRRHGGRVWAQGAVGRGATFYFTVPQPDRSTL